MSDSKQHSRRVDVRRVASARDRHTPDSTRHHQRSAGSASPDRAARHPAAPSSDLDQLGAEVVATRLRTLGHPTRLRIMRALDGRRATVDQLAEFLGEPVRAVRAQATVLYRAGVLCRVDDGGPPIYELADWPSLWLVEQLTRRLRQRAQASSSEEQGAC
jgi:DNA-binding transcriptional ArsR family regulator